MANAMYTTLRPSALKACDALAERIGAYGKQELSTPVDGITALRVCREGYQGWADTRDLANEPLVAYVIYENGLEGDYLKNYPVDVIFRVLASVLLYFE